MRVIMVGAALFALAACADAKSTPTPILCSQAFKADLAFEGIIVEAKKQAAMQELQSRGEDCSGYAANSIVEVR
ncbi:hypothetical protein [Rhodobacter sp. NSM]|uniref:hypothetical protein n=1 Tax=Rhodobacter sp. NSM TaxID=3457501 RepID=UPI003FD1C56D